MVGPLVGCASADVSPCRAMSLGSQPGSIWPERTPERTSRMTVFYGRAFKGLDGLTPEDLYAFVRQGALGGMPVQSDDAAARSVMESRFNNSNPEAQWSVWTPLDPDETLGRFHFARYRALGLPFEPVFQAAVETTREVGRDVSELDWRMCLVRDMMLRGELPLTRKDWPAVSDLWTSNAPPVHSVSFRHYQQPAYAVLRKVDALPLIQAVQQADGGQVVAP